MGKRKHKKRLTGESQAEKLELTVGERAAKIVSIVLAIFAAIGFLVQAEQYYSQSPAITPLDFSASDPFQVDFRVSNPMQFTMYDVELSGRIGPSAGGGDVLPSDKEWYERMGPRVADVCRELNGEPMKNDLKIRTPLRDDLIVRKTYSEFAPGAEDIFNPGTTAQGMVRFFYGIRIYYQRDVLGLIPLWHRSDCRLFESTIDSSGHMHLVPYHEAKQD